MVTDSADRTGIQILPSKGSTVVFTSSGRSRKWVVESIPLDYYEEVRTWDEIEITFRLSRAEKRNLSSLLDAAGKVSLTEKLGGGFKSEDRFNSNAKFSTISPTDRSNVRSVDTWFIEDYSEEVFDRRGRSWNLTITAKPDEHKTQGNQYGTLSAPFQSVTDEDDKWKFNFEYGEFLTENVTADFETSPDTQNKTYSIQMVLSPKQTRIVEESCGLLGAVDVKEVPDGDNFFVNTISSTDNEVNISPPFSAEDTISSGNYLVTDWETLFNQGAHIVSIDVVSFP